jgi:hypothetical protein
MRLPWTLMRSSSPPFEGLHLSAATLFRTRGWMGRPLGVYERKILAEGRLVGDGDDTVAVDGGGGRSSAQGGTGAAVALSHGSFASAARGGFQRGKVKDFEQAREMSRAGD